MELEQRILHLMEVKSWDIADVARIAGVSSSAVSQWLGRGNRRTRSIGDIGAAEKLSVASGYAALWIAKGKGPKMRDSSGHAFVVQESSVEYATTRTWPFEDDLYAQIMLLPREKRDDIERYMRYIVHESEAEAALKRKSVA